VKIDTDKIIKPLKFLKIKLDQTMKSNLISKSETDDLLKQVSAQWKIQIPKAKKFEDTPHHG